MPAHVSPQKQVVLLGASNLFRALSTVVETARLICGSPCRFLIACGAGRSYGVKTSALCRQLPGITECGLWDALREGQRLPTFALLTDIGTDIMYGYQTDTIIGWVRRCVDLLGQHSARTILMALPMQRIERVSPSCFLFFRSFLFPTQQIKFKQVIITARALNLALHDLAVEQKATIVQHEAHWYGLDPIHSRMRYWPYIYQQSLKPWLEVSREVPSRATSSLRRGLYLRLLVPHWRRICHHEQRRDQPAGVLPDGSTIAMY